MAFFLRHRWLTAFLILGILHWIVNPSGRFGITVGRFFVYNRVPIALFDVYIDTGNHISVLGDITEHVTEAKWFSEMFGPVLSGAGNKPEVLLVGTGFSKKSGFRIEQGNRHAIEFKGVQVVQVPSREAIRRYNRAKEENKPVAILLRAKN